MSNDVTISLQPHSPDNRALARECKDVKIDRVYIGSCTGGKTEDFMAAAKVFLASVRSCIIPVILPLDNFLLLICLHGFKSKCNILLKFFLKYSWLEFLEILIAGGSSY